MIKGISASRTIRSRLILMSGTILFLLFISLTATIYQSVKVIAIYDSMADYQQLSSSIFMRLADTSEALQKYLETRAPSDLDAYNKTYPQFLHDAFKYEEIERDHAGERTIVDFRYMVQSYLEAANRAVAYTGNNDLENSNKAYFEARKIQSLINGYLSKIFIVQSIDVARIDSAGKIAQRQSLMITAVVSLLIASISVLLTWQISLSITRPVSKLVSAAGDVSQGDWSTRVVPIKARNEMRLLGSAFNEMLDKIQEQMEQLHKAREREQVDLRENLERHKTESLLKEAQLKTLQARINPHFLFNTLNIIIQSAYLEDSRKTAEITEAFASLMRFNLEHFDGVVSLKEEFENLTDYIFLQRIRFENRIVISCVLDNDLEQEKLPGLLLQPLVENAISHGMGEITRAGQIHVSATSQGDHFTLVVKDNGIGMTAESLETARKYAGGDFPREYGNNIGIRNVFERVLLYTDGNAQIELESERGRGTDISITLPRGLEL